jgi:hypothetical protein
MCSGLPSWLELRRPFDFDLQVQLRADLDAMPVNNVTVGRVEVLLGLLIWPSAAFLIDRRLGRHEGPDVGELLPPYDRPSVADEAEEWLNNRQ